MRTGSLIQRFIGLFFSLISMFFVRFSFNAPNKDEAAGRFGLEHKEETEEEETEEAEETDDDKKKEDKPKGKEKESEADDEGDGDGDDADKKKGKEKNETDTEEEEDDDKKPEGVVLSDKITINDKEFNALCKKLKADLGDEEFDDLQENDKLFKKLLLKQYNLDNSEKAANAKHQENAKTRKENDAENLRIKAENERIKSENDKLEADKKALDEEQKKLEARLKKIDDEIDDETDDDKRQDLRMDKRDMNKRLDEIKTKELPNLKTTEEQLEMDKKVNYYLYCEKDALNNVPELRLSNEGLDFQSILEQDDKGTFKGDPDDLIRAEVWNRLWVDYLSKTLEYRKNNTISKFYDTRKRFYPLPDVKGTKKKDETKADDKKKGKEKDEFTDLYKKHAKNPGLPAGHVSKQPDTNTSSNKLSKAEKELQKNARARFNMEVEEEY